MRSTRSKSLALLGTAMAVWVVVAPGSASAQGNGHGQAPSGHQIAEKAKATKFDRARATTAKVQGKNVTVIPADADQLTSESEAKAGQVIGQLDTEVTGDETGLPPGKYNLYAEEREDGWHVYAESGGQVVKEGLRARADKTKDPASRNGKPEITEPGWCISIWIFSFCW
jgi:hypothetical protein